MLLGLLVDLLAGVLSGPHCSFQAPMFKNNTGGEPKVGHFFIAIGPGVKRRLKTSFCQLFTFKIPLRFHLDTYLMFFQRQVKWTYPKVG